MCKTRRVFSSSGEVCEASVRVNLYHQILIILRLRPELVNDQNDRTETKLYTEEIVKKVEN